MVFKLEWKIFGCEMWSIILWNTFCAVMPMIWVTQTDLTGYLLRRKVPKNGKVEPVFDIVAICLI